MQDPRTEAPLREARPVAEYVARFLKEENATLPRILVRSAECALIAGIELPRPILDIGCGDGTFAAAAFDERIDVGLDNSRPQMIRARKLHRYDSIVEASGYGMPFRDASFGSVFSNSTLEHIPRTREVIAEASRVLRPGGVLVVTVPSQHFPRYLAVTRLMRNLRFEAGAQAYERFFNRISRHVHIQPPETWIGWLADAGLAVDSWRYYYSRRDTVAFEITHYLTAPSVVTRGLLGRWVLWPGKAKYLPFAGVLARFSSPGPADEGAYILLRAHKQ